MNGKKKLHLIMPMGGAGSRFFNNGFTTPKPLIEIHGKPFFYWAARSIEKDVDLADITFVVLRKDIAQFQIDAVIALFFPNANIVGVDFDKVKAGPVLTCLAGLQHIHDDQPVLFNDCDHMFRCTVFAKDANTGQLDVDGALLTFKSDQPQFSYVQYNKSGDYIIGTVEKKVVSNDAICGAYIIKNASMFQTMAEVYLTECKYKEFFISGIYNIMCHKSLHVKKYTVDFHIPFGTPKEYEAAKKSIYFDELL